MKQQQFGIEIELAGIARKSGAETAAVYFGTQSYYEGTYYDTYVALDPQGREWKSMGDAGVKPERKEGRSRVATSDSCKTETVSPIYRCEGIETIQELVRKLREVEALANFSCGIHVHIDASPFDTRTLRNITNIMATKEDLIYKALQASVTRQDRWRRLVKERFLEELNQRKPGTSEEARQIWYNGVNRQREHYDNSRYHCLNLYSVSQEGIAEFRLFNGATHAGRIEAYIQLCLAVGTQTLSQTNASRRKMQTINEKYTFRIWLLRLGLNGDELKMARLHLLKHLDGCTTQKDPAQAKTRKERLGTKREKELQI